MALSGIAAENLEGGSGIASRTIASLEHGWEQGRDLLKSSEVLVIDAMGLHSQRFADPDPTTPVASSVPS